MLPAKAIASPGRDTKRQGIQALGDAIVSDAVQEHPFSALGSRGGPVAQLVRAADS